jgi:hypothetical protein
LVSIGPPCGIAHGRQSWPASKLGYDSSDGSADAGSILAVALLFVGDLLDDESLAPVVVPGAKAAFAFLLWLPLAHRFLRAQVLSLAQAGGLPATIRPARVAWIIGLATIPMAGVLDFASEGSWMDRYHPSSGYAFFYWAGFPLLAWIAVRCSRGGEPIA